MLLPAGLKGKGGIFLVFDCAPVQDGEQESNTIKTGGTSQYLLSARQGYWLCNFQLN